jgi:hypothetical protein
VLGHMVLVVVVVVVVVEELYNISSIAEAIN